MNEKLNSSVCVHVCVRALLYLQHTEDQNSHSTSKVGTILGSEDILVGLHNVKGQFEGLDLFWRLGLELGLG